MDLKNYEDAEEQIRAFGGNLVVNKVNAGTRAEGMGFRLGDAIKRVNGKAYYDSASKHAPPGHATSKESWLRAGSVTHSKRH